MKRRNMLLRLISCVLVAICCLTAAPNATIEGIAAEFNLPLYVRKGTPGIADDWNYAISRAETPLVTIAQQDDVYCPDYSTRMLAAVNSVTDSLPTTASCATEKRSTITRSCRQKEGFFTRSGTGGTQRAGLSEKGSLAGLRHMLPLGHPEPRPAVHAALFQLLQMRPGLGRMGTRLKAQGVVLL